MEENNQKPRLRFKGFTEAWEQRKFSDFGYVSMNKRIYKNQTTEKGEIPFYKIGTFGGSADAFISRELFEEFKNKYPYPKTGDILISASGSIGRTIEYLGEEAYYQDSNIVWLNHNNSLDNKFLKYLYSVVKWSGIEGSTIKRLYNSNILNTEFLIPNIEEQKKIGKYFDNLDNLITLHQRKCDKLVNVKKALLEKMFPNNGKNVPELRFKGFTEAWEQRELWEYTIWDKNFNDVEKIKQPKTIKYPYLLADEFKRIEDSTGDVQLLSTGQYIGFTSKEKAGKYLCNGEVVTIPWGGVPNIKYFKGFFVTTDNRIATSSDIRILNNKYLYYLLNHNISFIEGIYRGASIKHPSMSDLLGMKIMLPNIDEQERISKLLTKIDNLITLHQHKLEKLKNVKKSLLDKMFV